MITDVLAKIAARWFRRGPRWSTIAASFDDALRVYDRKGIWMVNYLRARRTADPLLSFFRRNHLKGSDNG